MCVGPLLFLHPFLDKLCKHRIKQQYLYKNTNQVYLILPGLDLFENIRTRVWADGEMLVGLDEKACCISENMKTILHELLYIYYIYNMEQFLKKKN